MKITLEDVEKIIRNFLLEDYKYFTHQAYLVGDTSCLKKQEGYSCPYFTSTFKNCNFNKSNPKCNYFRYNIDKGVYLRIYLYKHSQFKLDLFYHGVSLNLYRYYSNTHVAGFDVPEFFDKINIDDFEESSNRSEDHHEFTMINFWESNSHYKFFQLAVDDNTLIVNKTWMHNILGDDRRMMGYINRSLLEDLKINKIVFKHYTYSLTELLDVPSTLESVSFDLTKDKYNSEKDQMKRIILQNKELKPFIRDSKIAKKADEMLDHEESMAKYNTSVILEYEKNRGVVFTNLYAYEKFKNYYKGQDIIKKVKTKNVSDKVFHKMTETLSSNKIGDTNWFKEEFEVTPKNT